MVVGFWFPSVYNINTIESISISQDIPRISKNANLALSRRSKIPLGHLRWCQEPAPPIWLRRRPLRFQRVTGDDDDDDDDQSRIRNPFTIGINRLFGI